MLKLSNFTSALTLSFVAANFAIADAQTDRTVEIIQSAGEDISISADSFAKNTETNELIAEGNVVAKFGSRSLTADRLVYDENTEKVRASGNVVITTEEGGQQFAQEIEVSTNLDDGYAIGFSTRLVNGGTATANSAVRRSDGINALDQAIYTACDVCEGQGWPPTWQLRARRVVLNENTKTISYRDAVFQLAGIPVLYLPYFFHPDPSAGRRSGLLVPNVEVSDRTGISYTQPYYQVISDSADLTISPTFYTRLRPVLNVDFRKRFYRGDIEASGSFTYDRDFDNDGNRFGEDLARGHLFARGEFEFGDNWTAGFGIEGASDDVYLRQYGLDRNTADRSGGLYKGDQLNLISQLYVTGQDENFYVESALIAFQDLREDDPLITNAPIVTPVVFSERLFDFGNKGNLAVNLSSAILTRVSDAVDPAILNPDSRRISIGADYQVTRILPGGFVFEPFADVRGDYYNLNPESNLTQTSDIFRGLGSAGARLSWPLARPGKDVDILIEPVVMGAWGVASEEANDPAIPIEDSQFYEFDEASLFQSNGFGNFDRYEGDGRLSVGLNAKAKFKSGPTFSGIFGRRWRTDADPAFDQTSNLDGTSSDWLAAFSVDFGKILELNTRLRLSPENFGVERVDTGASLDFWRLRGDARYYRIDDDITADGLTDEGFAVSAAFSLTERISLQYQQQRNFTDQFDAFRSIGVSYSDGCSTFEIAYERSELNDRTIGANDSFQFRFYLKTLGGTAAAPSRNGASSGCRVS